MSKRTKIETVRTLNAIDIASLPEALRDSADINPRAVAYKASRVTFSGLEIVSRKDVVFVHDVSDDMVAYLAGETVRFAEVVRYVSTDAPATDKELLDSVGALL